jgi:hypothetical protein
MRPTASVIAVPLVCDRIAPVYRVHGSLGPSARIELASALEASSRELEARAELQLAHKHNLYLFEHLLYTYRRPAGAVSEEKSDGADTEQRIETAPAAKHPWVGPRPLPMSLEGGLELRNVLAIAHRALTEKVPVSGLWSRPLTVYRSSPMAACAPLLAGASLPAETQLAEGSPSAERPVDYIDRTPQALFIELLQNILDFLAATRKMVEIYSANDMIMTHRTLWTIMREAQLSPPHGEGIDKAAPEPAAAAAPKPAAAAAPKLAAAAAPKLAAAAPKLAAAAAPKPAAAAKKSANRD